MIALNSGLIVINFQYMLQVFVLVACVEIVCVHFYLFKLRSIKVYYLNMSIHKSLFMVYVNNHHEKYQCTFAIQLMIIHIRLT